MHIYLKNNSAIFHSDPIWNDVALTFFGSRSPQQENEEQEEEQQDEYKFSLDD